MKRELNRLSENTFDILIVGGGIYGAALAWRAAVENYKVGLIEKNDFASGTSSNSQKIIHGGLRYLSKFDFKRIMQSQLERKRLMWIAPHLINPMPFTLPIYNHGIKGKEGMKIALKIYDFLTYNRNKGMDPEKYIPNCRFLSRNKIPEVFDKKDYEEIIGGINWYDGFCFNTERLIISFIKSAVKFGAFAANYVSANKLTTKNGKVESIKVADNLTGDSFHIKAKNVVNCTGTFLNDIFFDEKTKGDFPLVSGINIITRKLFDHSEGIGFKSKNKKSRYYFVVPWGNKSIIGTEWFYDSKNDYKVKENECLQFIENLNIACPSLELKLEDILYVTKGYVFGKKTENDPFSTLDEYAIQDAQIHGVSGLFNVIGVKYTTAVSVAEETLKKIDSSFKKRKLLDNPKLIGGEINSLSDFRRQITKKFNEKIEPLESDSLINNYGTESLEILNLMKEFQGSKACAKAKTIFSVREEMAFSLSDIVLRRTDFGSSEKPSDSELKLIADTMAKELNWNQEKKQEEINRINNFYPSFIESRINEKVLN